MNRTGYHWELYTYLSNLFRTKKEPHTKFVIFTVGRSGSSLLVSLLNSNPQIHCVGELLGKKLFSPKTYLQQVSLINQAEVFGFKLNTYHFKVQNIPDPPAFVDDLHQADYEIISLKRENILRQVISHIYAVQRGKFHHKESDGNQKQDKIKIDLDVLRDELDLFTGYQAVEDRILDRVPHISLSYERDLADPAQQQETVDRISQVLGIPSAPARTDFVKTTPRELSSIILNYREVQNYLQNSQYAGLLVES